MWGKNKPFEELESNKEKEVSKIETKEITTDLVFNNNQTHKTVVVSSDNDMGLYWSDSDHKIYVYQKVKDNTGRETSKSKAIFIDYSLVEIRYKTVEINK